MIEVWKKFLVGVRRLTPTYAWPARRRMNPRPVIATPSNGSAAGSGTGANSTLSRIKLEASKLLPADRKHKRCVLRNEVENATLRADAKGRMASSAAAAVRFAAEFREPTGSAAWSERVV